MSKCYVNTAVEHRCHSNKAFMGLTHSLSCVALFLAIAAFAPEHMHTALGSSSLAVIILAMMNAVGSSLLPDLDNSSSTSKSALGLLGDLLSVIFRTSSEIIQTTVRSKYDKDKPNPHRGFYHTALAAFIIGALVAAATQVGGSITLPGIGKVSWGFVIAIVITWLNLHMALAGLFKQGIKKIKKQGGFLGEPIAFALSLGIAGMVFTQVPTDTNYWWVGVAVAFGMIVHDLGDMVTTAGVPLLFPIPRKGKLWWNYRLTPIHSGGVLENMVIIPFFLVVSVIAFVKVLGVF